MARLYNAFNALSIGDAINGRENALYNRRMSVIDSLSNSLQDHFEQKRQEEREAQQKTSAVEFLKTLGMSDNDAAAYVNSVGAKDAATAMFNKRNADEEYRRNLADRRQDTKDAWDREDNVHTRDRTEHSLDAGFNRLYDSYIAQQTKVREGVPTRLDMEEYNRVYGALADFVKKHPEYGVVLADKMMEGNSGKGISTREDYIDALNDLDKEGVVDSASIAELKDRMVKDMVFEKMMADKDFAALWRQKESRQKGGKKERDMKNLGAGNVHTEEDAKNEYAKAEEAKRIEKNRKALQKWYNGEGPMPDIDEKDYKNYPAKIIAEYKREKNKKGK
jgi:hypothetical protein